MHTYKLNGYEYSASMDSPGEQLKFDVNYPGEIRVPASLYKLYPLCSNSVDALSNSYFFSSHPYFLNDKFDCAPELIDYSNVSLETAIAKISFYHDKLDPDTVIDMYHSGKKWQLERILSGLDQNFTYASLGVISLTEQLNNILMWSYYNSNFGFAVKINTAWKERSLFGPFPIQYLEEMKRIDVANYDLSVCLLYQSCVKYELWKHENEWRYFTHNPSGKYHPIHNPKELQSRKFQYNSEIIEEVILGYNFFNPVLVNAADSFNKVFVMDFRNRRRDRAQRLRYKIMDVICERSLPCSLIAKCQTEYLLGKASLKIQRLSKYRFKVMRSTAEIISFGAS